MAQSRKVRLLISVPFMRKGTKYWMHNDTQEVFWIDRKGKISDYPLRKELSGYLWMLATSNLYIKVLETRSEPDQNKDDPHNRTEDKQ